MGGIVMLKMTHGISLIAAVMALPLATCATLPQKQWYKEGASPQEFSIDQGQCRAQGFGISGGTLMQAAIVFIPVCKVRVGCSVERAVTVSHKVRQCLNSYAPLPCSP